MPRNITATQPGSDHFRSFPLCKISIRHTKKGCHVIVAWKSGLIPVLPWRTKWSDPGVAVEKKVVTPVLRWTVERKKA